MRATRSRAWSLGVVAAALLVAAAWLPFLDLPLSSDESGFLLLARHWHHGSSLYGDYWVDRPPLLLWLFGLGGHLGPVLTAPTGLLAPGVKLLGAAASGVSMVLVGVLARLLVPARSATRWLTLVAAAALLSSPLLGMPETDGEVLALPFVLLGLACLVAGLRPDRGRGSVLLWSTAGVSAVGAALVKQNVIDVFVFALVLLVASRRDQPVPARAAAFLAGVASALVLALGPASLRGAAPGALWEATVTFRLDAAAVIGTSASHATGDRFARLGLAALASGVVALLALGAAAAVGRLSRRADPVHWDRAVPQADPVTRDRALTRDRAIAWAALALAAWELLAVAAGGSYWLHYLTGTVPGIVLLLLLVRPTPRWRAAGTAAVTCAVLASAVMWGRHVVAPVVVSDDAHVMSYVRHHAGPGDGVVVAFGHPDIVAGTGLSSPYEYLWSLPVRVRDHRLAELRAVLDGPEAPRWVVVGEGGLGTWGVRSAATQRDLERNYAPRAAYGRWQVWRRRIHGPRPLGTRGVA